MGWKSIVWLATIGVITGCLATEPDQVSLGQEFELSPNQSVRVAQTSLTVGFRGVAGDSRCPLDALCAVAGSAGIQLDIFGTSAENPIVLGSSAPDNRWTDGAYIVEVVDLQPSRLEGADIKPEEYRVRLLVSAAGP